MSRVHANGRMIAARVDVVYDLMHAMRHEAVAIARGIELDWLASKAAELIDGSRASGLPVEPAPLHHAWCELDDRRREVARTMRRDPTVDVGFELWLFPFEDRTLILLHTEQRSLTEWFDALPFVEDRSWRDDVDPDEDVPSDEWDARGRDWSILLPVGSTPNERCLVMTLCDAHRLPADPKDVLEHVAPLADRIDAIARSKHVSEISRRLLGEAPVGAGDRNMHEVLSMHRRACEEADLDEDRRRELRADMAARLRPIGIDDL